MKIAAPFIVVILLSSFLFAGTIGSTGTQHVYAISSVSGGAGSYDADLYGRFFLSRDALDMQVGEVDESYKCNERITLDVSFTYNVSVFQDPFYKEMFNFEEPVTDIEVKFILLNREKWLPMFNEVRSDSRLGEMPCTTEMGREMEELITTLHDWYEHLEKRTGSIYTLDHDPIRIDDENTAVNTTVSISIAQGGTWRLAALARPAAGGYWMEYISVVKDMNIERPTGVLHSSLPYIASALVIVPAVILYWKVKKRS